MRIHQASDLHRQIEKEKASMKLLSILIRP
jgi:hypothetical protein